jgi:superkiller protein 3
MKAKPASLVLVVVLALFQTANPIAQTSRGNQATNPAYLSQFPSVERVKAEIKGTDAMDTAARQMGALWQLQEIIKELSGFRWTRNQLTPDENRLLGQYAAGYQTAGQPYERIQNAPSHPDKPKWYRMHAFYETDDGFREELFNRLLSPALRAEYAKVKGETRATVQARQEARENAWKEEQARARAAPSGGAQPYKREEQAAQAMLDGLVKATTDLFKTLNSQVQTAQSTAARPSAASVQSATNEAKTGQAYFKVKDYTRAIQHFNNSIAIVPSSAAYAGLGSAYYGLKQYPQAIEAYKQVIRMVPNNAEVHLWLAMAYYEYGSDLVSGPSASKDLKPFESAETEAREAIRLKPDYQTAYFYLGGAASLQKKYSEAVAAFQQAIRLKADDQESLYVLGAIYAKLGKKEEAMQVYQKLAALNKEYAQRLLTEINGLELAQQVFAEINNPTNSQPGTKGGNPANQPASGAKTPQPSGPAGAGAEAYLAEGHKYRTAKDYPRAIETYKKAISLKPTDVAYYFLGTCYDDQRQYQLAIPAYKQSLALQPDAGVFLVLGIANRKLEKYDEALKAFQEAISLKPKLETLARAHFWIGKTYNDLRQEQNAVTALQEALRLKPDSAEAHTVLGGSYLNLGQYPNALTEYQQAVRLKPDDAKGHFWIAVVYNDLKQPDKAVPAFRESLRLKPDDLNVIYQLGETYYQLKQYPNALAAFEQMLRLSPNHSAALYKLGITYVGMGKKDDALQIYRRLQTIDAQKAEWLHKEMNKSN